MSAAARYAPPPAQAQGMERLSRAVEHALRGESVPVDCRSAPGTPEARPVELLVAASDADGGELARLVRQVEGGRVQIPVADVLEDERVHLSSPAGDKPFVRTDEGLLLSVGDGERCRLWLQPAEPDRWLHMMLVPRFTGAPEPIVTLRYLHENDNEQVALRFRRNSVVLHKEVEVAVPPRFLVSLGFHDGRISIFVNGVPVYRRAARHPHATAFMLDAIGVADGTTEMGIHFLATEPTSPWPLGLNETDCGRLAAAVLEAAFASSSRSRFHEMVHALADMPLALPPDRIRVFIAAVRDASAGTYADVVEDLLLARLDEKERSAYVADRPTAVLKVANVSIALSSNPASKGLAALLAPTTKTKLKVVDNVSFNAFSGDIVGIIGKNGAGKTTFLKSLVGAIPIATGRIDIEERPILLRPGAGMQGELTGRQNIYKTGLYMNMSKRQIDDVIDDVIEFAELREHIDRPFKYYSDGMRARLIFSMATALPHEILLLDELLSAGDMGFQERAMQRLHRFLEKSRLVLVVQHTFDFVLSRCTKCLLLEKGVPVYFGDPHIATELYKESL